MKLGEEEIQVVKGHLERIIQLKVPKNDKDSMKPIWDSKYYIFMFSIFKSWIKYVIDCDLEENVLNKLISDAIANSPIIEEYLKSIVDVKYQYIYQSFDIGKQKTIDRIWVEYKLIEICGLHNFTDDFQMFYKIMKSH